MKTCLSIFLLLLATAQLKAQDKEISDRISAQLNVDIKETGLYYPASVKRFYQQSGFQPVWIKPQPEMGSTWQAMLMLDCVLQFGLAYADYHPYELSYDSLHIMLEKPYGLTNDEKARFDIVLTDAMITFMNHLYYGKFNPEYLAGRLDEGKNIPFLAEKKLREALLQKDLMASVGDVQPKNIQYQELQQFMRQAKGQYAGDCYDIPEADIRLAAINMERLRWANFPDGPYIHVNIPSYALTLAEPDSVYIFKAIVGKPENPTPAIRSAIGYFTTAPDWKVPQKIFIKELLPKALADTRYFEAHQYAIYDKSGVQLNISSPLLKEISKRSSGYSLRQSSGCDNALGAVVFRFPNTFDIYLHDSPDQKLFDRKIRSLSHGCIRVQKAADLAALLLKYDGAADQIPLLRQNTKNYLRRDFILKKPVPIRVTYLTCGIKDGLLERYKDIYRLDPLLEAKLYNIQQQLAQN